MKNDEKIIGAEMALPIDPTVEMKVAPNYFHTKYSEVEMRPTEYLLYPYLLKGSSFNAVVGASGSGKTFLAGVDWPLSYSAGFKEWLGHPFSDESEDRKVIYMPSEGYDEAQKRIRAWLQYHNLPRTALDGHFFLLDLPTLLEKEKTNHITEKTAVKLHDSIEAHIGNKIDLIVLDTLNGFCGVKENSNDEIGNFLALVETYLSAPFNASILFIHHTGKKDKGADSAADIDPRGASAFEGRMDSLNKVHGKIGTGLHLFNAKNRSAEEGTEDYVIGKKIDPIEDSPVDSHGNKANSLVIDWEADPEEIEKRRKKDPDSKFQMQENVKRWKRILEEALNSGEVAYTCFYHVPDEEEEKAGEPGYFGIEVYSKDLEGYLLKTSDINGDRGKLSKWLGTDSGKMMRTLESQNLLTIEKLESRMSYRYILRDNNQYTNNDGVWNRKGFPTSYKMLGKFPGKRQEEEIITP